MISDDSSSDVWKDVSLAAQGTRCGLCDATPGAWVHVLDEDKETYEAWQESYTLLHAWVFCEECEAVLQTKSVPAIVARINAQDAGWGDVDDAEEDLVKPVKALLEADIGRKRLT
jgi:hypothetical protein